jgi:hypothetical protein
MGRRRRPPSRSHSTRSAKFFFVGTWFPTYIAIVKPLELAELAEELVNQWDAIKIRWHCSTRMLSALVRNSSALSPQRSPFLEMVALMELQSGPNLYRPPNVMWTQKIKLDVMFLSMRYQHHPP